jgi:hypothetical protein
MRVIILMFGFVFLDLLSKHWGINIGSNEDILACARILFPYAIILDLIKK